MVSSLLAETGTTISFGAGGVMSLATGAGGGASLAAIIAGSVPSTPGRDVEGGIDTGAGITDTGAGITAGAGSAGAKASGGAGSGWVSGITGAAEAMICAGIGVVEAADAFGATSLTITVLTLTGVSGAFEPG